MAYNPAIRSINKPNAPRITQVANAPAPVGGIDSRSTVSGGSTANCLYTYNLIPSDRGLTLRKGYREWQIGLTGAGVRTIIPFNDVGTTGDKLFAVTNEGIYDVTAQAGTPVLKTDPLEWLLTGDEAGWGVFTNYVTLNGDALIFYADPVNGLFQYTAATDTWAQPTGITGIAVGNINFVMVHKLRIWFCLENSANGYYLDINAVAGAVTPFAFGGKFKHGGALKGLYNWTVDGGIGVDDYLVAIGNEGDVLPYQGSDPGEISWSLAGSYYVGTTVRGGRCASQQGGNLHIMSAYGLISMSDLLRGVLPRQPNAQSISAKIAPFLRKEVLQSINTYGWSVLNLDSQGALVIVTPTASNGSDVEYVYSLAVNGWGLWRDIPINCIDSWGSIPYIGTADGRILAMDVVKDNVQLTPVLGQKNGVNIQFSILFNYNDLGGSGLFKRGVLIRPDFISKGNVSVETKFMYDYDLGEIETTPTDAGVVGSTWDNSKWDSAVWNNSVLTHKTSISGSSGIGRMLSIALKGNALSDTIFASADIFYNVGGGL